jgi:aspartoacylase
MAIEHVLLVGGTHGNELTGVYLIKQFERSPEMVQRSSFKTSTLLANPEAFQLGKRYVDADLNRQFRRHDLADPTLSGYEAQRAKAIYHQFGPDSDHPVDLTVDLHSSTANMGLTIILASNVIFNLMLAAHLVSINPNVKILYSNLSIDDNPYLDSISQFGCKIEVGAVAQGVLDAALFQQAATLVYATLDYVESYNQKLCANQSSLDQQRDAGLLVDSLLVYHRVGIIDYPRDEQGEIQAMIHPRLQFQDYQPLQPGDPMFLTFAGDTIAYQGNSTVYPVFINEAAYYEKGIAMCLTEKRLLNF